MNLRHNLRAPWLRNCCMVALLLVAFLHCQPAVAQDTDTEPVTLTRPLVVFNLSSYEKLLDEISYIFDTVERPDLMDIIKSLIKNNLRDLKGVSKDQPMGVMLFLRSVFPPQIEPILYMPVENIEEATETVQERGNLVKKTDEGRYKIVNARRTRYVRVQGKYAFVFLGDAENAEEVLDRKFPDPAGYAKRMSRQYDFCISLDLTSVPDGMKQLGMGFLKAQSATEMQQRDDEADGVYQIRRAQAERTLNGIDLLLKHGERLEFGIDASREERTVKLEVQVDARKDSPLAKNIDEMNSKRSYFSRLFNEDAAFSFSTSAAFDDTERDMYLKVLDGVEIELLSRIDEDKPDLNPQPITNIIEALRKTAKMQHTDIFLQCYGQPPELRAIGGMRVKDGTAIGSGLAYIAEQFKDEPGLQTLEINQDSHQNVAFHRLGSKDDRGVEVVGANPAIYVGVSSQVLWFAVGGDGAMDQLKTTMDTLMLPSDKPRSQERPPAIRVVFNAKQWMGLLKTDDSEVDPEDERAVRRSDFRNMQAEIVKKAFENGDDRLEIDLRPVQSGARLQLKLDEGFVRMIGGMAATGFDMRGERRGRRRRPDGDE